MILKTNFSSHKFSTSLIQTTSPFWKFLKDGRRSLAPLALVASLSTEKEMAFKPPVMSASSVLTWTMEGFEVVVMITVHLFGYSCRMPAFCFPLLCLPLLPLFPVVALLGGLAVDL